MKKIYLLLSILFLSKAAIFAGEADTAPVITISPTTLPDFTCAVGESVSQTVTVNAVNCTDYVYIYLTNNGGGSAFTINNSMMPKNVQGGLSKITFHPLKEGEYTATVRYQTTGGQTCTISLKGKATKETDPSQELTKEFHFDNKNPRAKLIERFDAVGHNTQLLLTDWQNVVKAGTRPWWGIDNVNDEDMHCAKATAFVSGQTDDTEWEQWLVTPALDYKNAVNQIFTFRVRGDYIYDGMPTALEIYYIDALSPTDVYMQQLEVGIPSTTDERRDWVDIHIDLTGQDETIADIFYMAFRYIGPSGVDGAPTYYIDDVTWGNPELPVISSDSTQITFTTAPGVAEGTEFHIVGKNLTEEIKIELTGSNPSSFSLATEKSTKPEQAVTLPKTGGLVAIALIEDIEGVYEAYLAVSSRGAATLYIPVACLVKTPTGLTKTKTKTATATKRIENGLLQILYNGKRYDARGRNL